jgi:hypothetical protein
MAITNDLSRQSMPINIACSPGKDEVAKPMDALMCQRKCAIHHEKSLRSVFAGEAPMMQPAVVKPVVAC